MEKSDRDRRVEALTRLAVALREFPAILKPEDRKAIAGFLAIFLEDTARFPTDVVVRACRHLEATQTWFPKPVELIEACQAIVQRDQEAREAEQRKRLLPPKISDERFEEIKARIRAAIGRKSM